MIRMRFLADDIKAGTPTLVVHWNGAKRPGEVASAERDDQGCITVLTVRDESDGRVWTFWNLGDDVYRGVCGWTLSVGAFDFNDLAEPNDVVVVHGGLRAGRTIRGGA